jgi:hypothetical protein
MRTVLGMVLVILLGVGLGIGTATFRVHSTPWNPKLDEGVETTAAEALPPSGPAPKVVVDRTEFDFGTLDMDSSGSHVFTIANKGDAPLTLSEGGTSCRCTMSKLDREKIPPGGSAKVTITWKPTDKPGPYQQTAKILTNDPAKSQIALTISGRISTAMRFSPSELVLSSLSVGDGATAQSRLFYYLDEPLKIVGQKWSDPATAAHFEATLLPLSKDALKDELKDEPALHSGWLVKVTVKPGLPPGPFQQRLLLQTNLTSRPEAMLPIQGTVGSEIAVAGRGWDPDTGILTLGEISRNAGYERKLMLIVRGPARKQVKFKPARVAPDTLHVSLGQASELNHGVVVEVPLLIQIPQGSPPANHLGSEQGRLGEIILETTHPQVPKLRILVRFAIEG